MVLAKSFTKNSLLILLIMISACHLACMITLIINDFLFMIFYYGLYLLSLCFTVFFAQTVLFVKNEDYIVEIFCGLLLADLVSLFFLAPTAFMTQYRNVGYSGVDFNPQLITLTVFLTSQIILQTAAAWILMSNISYFNIYGKNNQQLHAESDGWTPSRSVSAAPPNNN